MAKTKNQFDRLQILHNLLAKCKPVSWTEIEKSYLHNGITVTKKTIFNDLDSLEETYKAPIKNEKGKYNYTQAYSFLNIFSVNDSLLANEVQILLQQFAEFPAFKGLDDIWIKLKERIPNTSKENIVQFESNNDYSGLKRITELYEAIKNEECIKIKYQDFGKELREYTISPYLLKEYHNRWHIYGYEFKKEKIYNLALDRILSIEKSSFSFRKQQSTDLTFLNDIIGFTYLYDDTTDTFAQLATVKIKVESKRANYIGTKPLHHSQQEIETSNSENFKMFEYRLRINDELISKILEFGKDAEVLEPLSLREEMIEHVLGMLEVYK